MEDRECLIRPFLPIGAEAVVATLCQLGGVAFPVLSESAAAYLAQTVASLPYEEQPTSYGPRRVRQDLASCPLSALSLLTRVVDALECQLRDFFGPEILAPGLAFNHRIVQRYRAGTIGIEPHRDESVFRNLIGLLGLGGSGRFTIYEHLGGPVRARWDIHPGTLLLMVAPGFSGVRDTDRPVHGVSSITGDPYRYVVGLRQRV